MEPLKFNTLDNMMAGNPADKLSKQALDSIKTTQTEPPRFDLPPHFISPIIAKMEGHKQAGEKQYVVAHNKEQLGPFSLLEIRTMFCSGEIDYDTFVWKPGLPQWTQVRDCQDIVQQLNKQ